MVQGSDGSVAKNERAERRVRQFYRTSSFATLVGLGATITGVVLGIAYGQWGVLWIGLGTMGVGGVGVTIALLAAMGLARLRVEEDARAAEAGQGPPGSPGRQPDSDLSE